MNKAYLEQLADQAIQEEAHESNLDIQAIQAVIQEKVREAYIDQ